MPSMTPLGSAWTRCPSLRRRCSRHCGPRRRGTKAGSDRRASPPFPGPSRRECPHRGREATAGPSSKYMLRLPSFRYLQPSTLSDALTMKGDAGPDGMFVAGGTDLYPNMKRRHQEPRVVISLMGISELMADGRIGGSADRMVLGAGVTLTKLSDHPTIRRSAVGTAARLVSTPLLRNMGTLGGNLCLDTRCNYYNQSYEWRKSIDFCMK